MQNGNRAERHQSTVHIEEGDLIVPARIAEHPELTPTAKLLYGAAWRAVGYRRGRCQKSLPTLAGMIGADPRSLRDSPRGPGPFARLVEIGAFDLICAEPRDFWVNASDELGKPRKMRGLDFQRALPGVEPETIGDICANVSVPTGPADPPRGDLRANVSAHLVKFPGEAMARGTAARAAEGGKGGGLELPSSNKQNPPPPSPSRLIGRGKSSPGEWDRAEQLLLEVGVYAAPLAIRKAKQSDVDARSVVALVSYFADHRDLFESPGALFTRLQVARPGQPVDSLWIAKSTMTTRREHREASMEQSRRRQTQLETERAAREAEVRKRDELLEKFQAPLRALSSEQAEALLQAAGLPEILREFYRRDGFANVLVLDYVLPALEQRPNLLDDFMPDARAPPAE